LIHVDTCWSNFGENNIRINIYGDSFNDSLEKAMKYLKRQLKDDDTMMTLRNNRYYEKPSMRRRRELDEAKRFQWTEDRKAERANKGHCWTAIVDGKAS